MLLMKSLLISDSFFWRSIVLSIRPKQPVVRASSATEPASPPAMRRSTNAVGGRNDAPTHCPCTGLSCTGGVCTGYPARLGSARTGTGPLVPGALTR